MASTLAFDVYGTLIDPFDISTELEAHVADRAPQFAQIWREKQIEYLFRRALMRDYRDFSTCTRQALVFTASRLQTRLTADVQDALMAKYRELPAYSDVPEALAQLSAHGHAIYAFSNGQPDDLEYLLAHAELDKHLDGIVSVHDVESFKPDPVVYRYFLECTGAAAGDTFLISGNSFDVVGAHAVGWNTVWVKRDATAVFDPWGIEPTATIAELGELVASFERLNLLA